MTCGRARRYYDVIMPLLGFETFLAADDEFAYRPMHRKPGTYLFFYPAADRGKYSRQATGLQHLAFMVPTRTAVRQVRRHVADLVDGFGGELLHEPQVFPQYPQPLFAMFWLDPWGLMLEAVCHHDRE
jgi:hypothetical protein